MSKTIQEERYRWIKPIIDKEIKLVDIAKVCPYSERSLKRWCKLFRKGGIDALIPKSTRPRTQPNETPIRVKEEVIALRKETGLCALKLHWKLKKKGLFVPVSTTGKILKDEGLVRKYRIRKIKYKYVKVPLQAGELVEIDVKYVPGKVAGRYYFQFTAIDCSSRWRYLRIYDEQIKTNTIDFVKEIMKKFPYEIKAIKTDNHSIFTNRHNGGYARSNLMFPREHLLDRFCREHNIIHYLIDPGKPAQNGKIERSHREDQEKFYEKNIFKNLKELEEKIILWNDYYNDLEHCGLSGKTPNEMLRVKVPNVVG